MPDKGGRMEIGGQPKDHTRCSTSAWQLNGWMHLVYQAQAKECLNDSELYLGHRLGQQSAGRQWFIDRLLHVHTCPLEMFFFFFFTSMQICNPADLHNLLTLYGQPVQIVFYYTAHSHRIIFTFVQIYISLENPEGGRRLKFILNAHWSQSSGQHILPLYCRPCSGLYRTDFAMLHKSAIR